jgi:lipopolysaccharide export system ATP-binding protein
MTGDPILQADSIGKSFSRRRVLSAATLLAIPGRITVLLGRNGAGKSTLMKIAAGWVPPDYGVVIFREKRFTHPRPAELASMGLFFLPERALLWSSVTLRQHFQAVERRFPHSADESQRVMRLFRLEALADRRPAALSGGERRRADVAVAFARRPDCLLADEPFEGTAPTDAELLCAGFRELARRGAGIVITGHEAPTLLDLADYVVWQTAGTTHFLGTPSEARANDQFVREYLGTGRSP